MDKTKSTSIFPAGATFDVIVMTLLWCVAVIIVRPIGDFPLNDDWSYGWTVKRLVEGGGYRPTGWTEMTLITHALWGALFCIPHGFSFTALRFSTLVLSLFGVLAMYGLIRQLNKSRFLAVGCALTLGGNPIYFALSNTFMTDVPFTTLAILSALFFVRHLQKGSDVDLILGTAFALATILCRQLGLFLPLAFGPALLLKHGFQRRWIIRAVLPLIVSIAVLAAFQHWLKATGKLPALYNLKAERLITALTHPIRIPLNVAYYGWSILMYLGWFLLPVTLLAPLCRQHAESDSRSLFVARLAVILFLVASVFRFVIVPSLMPVHNNIIIPQGIGPATLRDTYSLHLPHLPSLPGFFWLLVTVMSLLGAALFIYKATRVLVNFFTTGIFNGANDDKVPGIFFLLCACIYLAPFVLSGFFDRYLLPVMAFLAAFLAVLEEPRYRHPPANCIAAILLIASLGIFSIAGTRDYLEWNRTRWIASGALLAQKQLKPKDIDGGFEFNGWYLFDTFTKTNWWIVNDTYVISFGEVRGYEPVNHYKYTHWMPPHEGSIFVLKRKAGE